MKEDVREWKSLGFSSVQEFDAYLEVNSISNSDAQNVYVEFERMEELRSFGYSVYVRIRTLTTTSAYEDRRLYTSIQASDCLLRLFDPEEAGRVIHVLAFSRSQRDGYRFFIPYDIERNDYYCLSNDFKSEAKNKVKEKHGYKNANVLTAKVIEKRIAMYSELYDIYDEKQNELYTKYVDQLTTLQVLFDKYKPYKPKYCRYSFDPTNLKKEGADFLLEVKLPIGINVCMEGSFAPDRGLFIKTTTSSASNFNDAIAMFDNLATMVVEEVPTTYTATKLLEMAEAENAENLIAEDLRTGDGGC